MHSRSWQYSQKLYHKCFFRSLFWGKTEFDSKKKRAVIVIFGQLLKKCLLDVSGGAAEHSGLQSGDEVLQVQGISLQDMTRFEAWSMIKALPEGPITVVLKRRLGAAE